VGYFMYSLYWEFNSWWQNGSLLSFLVFWWIGVFAQKQETWVHNAKFKVSMIIEFIILTYLLLQPNNDVNPQILRALAEIRRYILAFLACAIIKNIENNENIFLYFFKLGAIFGKISYSVYALRAPLSILLLIYFNLDWYLIIPIVISISYLTHKYVELPFIRKGRLLSYTI